MYYVAAAKAIYYRAKPSPTTTTVKIQIFSSHLAGEIKTEYKEKNVKMKC